MLNLPLHAVFFAARYYKLVKLVVNYLPISAPEHVSHIHRRLRYFSGESGPRRAQRYAFPTKLKARGNEVMTGGNLL